MPGRVAGILEAAIDRPRQKISQTEAEFAAKILVEILLHRSTVEVDANLHIMFINFPGKVVEDLDVAVNTMTGHAAGGSKLGNPADGDDGQAGVEWRCGVAQGRAGRCTEAD